MDQSIRLRNPSDAASDVAAPGSAPTPAMLPIQPPAGIAAWDSKSWLPRRFARLAINAALEFQGLLDIQPVNGLRDPDCASDARHGPRYGLAMNLLLSSVRTSHRRPPTPWMERTPDIAGIFAVFAAQEFKYLLDVQPPGTLFFPGGARKGRPDARQSRTYTFADSLLNHALSNVLHGTSSDDSATDNAIAVRCVVSDGSADAPADILELHAYVQSALLSLGLEQLDQNGSGGKHGCFLEFRLGTLGQVDQALKAVKGDGNAVHGTAPEKVDGMPLCHAAAVSKEVR
jgi:hypothetical protein